MIHDVTAISLCLSAAQVVNDDHPYVTITYGSAGRSESVRLTVTAPVDWDDARDWARQMLAAAVEAL